MAGLFSAASGDRGMAAAEDDGALYWGSLEREVRGLMEGATAAEAVLSSDEEGAADELLEGVTLGWSRSRRVGTVQAEYVEPPRSESKVTAASEAFHNRLAATFGSLPSPAAIAAVRPGAPGVFGRVGPAFSRQCEGHSLAEPESDGSWQSILAQEARIQQQQQEQDTSCPPDHVDEASLTEMARKAAIAAEVATGDAAESSGEEGEENQDWDQGWEDPDELRGGGSEDEDVGPRGEDRACRAGAGGAGLSRRTDGSRRSTGVSAHDVAEWSMHTASWARDGTDSDDDDVPGEAGLAAARDAARRMAAAASAEGLAPSEGAAAAAGSGFCAPAFGGLDDLDELGTAGGGAVAGWAADALPHVSTDMCMDVSTDVSMDVSNGAVVGGWTDAGRDPARAASGQEGAAHRPPAANAHTPTDASKRSAPHGCAGASGTASEGSSGVVGGGVAGRPPHASAKRVRFDGDGSTGAQLRGPIGLVGSDPFVRELLDAGRGSALPSAGLPAASGLAASGARGQGAQAQGAGAASPASVPCPVAGLGVGSPSGGGMGVPEAELAAGQRRAGDGASCAGRPRSGGQRAGYTLYTLEDVADSNETNLAALSQARAIVAGAWRPAGVSAGGASCCGSSPTAEAGREATFGRRPARPAPAACGGASGGRAAGPAAAAAVRLDHLEDAEELMLAGTEEGQGGGGLPPSGRPHLGGGQGGTATNRRFRRPGAGLADSDMDELG